MSTKSTQPRTWPYYLSALIGVTLWGCAIIYGFMRMHEAHPSLFN